MSRQWGNQRQKQGGVQGLNNGKGNASLQQQQLSAAQLTYAQKVKGRRTAQPKAQQLQQGQGGMRNPQFRMVQTQNILQPQVSALQNYAYPYNYSNLQQQQQQQQQRRPPTKPYPQTQPQSQQQQQSANPYRTRRGTGPQRDFFDRRVQHNVNNAVSQYYNYPTPQNNSNGMNRYVSSQRQQQQQQSMYRQQSNPQFRFNSNNNNNNMSNNNNMNMNMRGRRNQRFRGGRGGGRGSFGQRPSYRDSQRPNFNRMQQQQQQGNIVSNKANKRTKPSELQLNRYQNAADRDVLCWIFENQGKCRYGEKCQWLHLDRETGQYIPTVYIMNSLSDKNIRKNTICKEVDATKKDEKEKDEADDDDDDDEKVEEAEDESESDTDPEELKNKFLLLMAEGIKKREKEEKERLIEEETKKNEEEKEKAQKQKRGKDEEDEDTKEQQQCLPVDSEKKSKYASYGTTFDRHNVCWEFNTFVGCRKGSKCKWAHQYLVKESAHPYTGEKLNGMAVRKFRVSNNI